MDDFVTVVAAVILINFFKRNLIHLVDHYCVKCIENAIS